MHGQYWFGRSWGAPCCEPEMHVQTPVGRACLFCEEPIAPEDIGFVTALLTHENDRFVTKQTPIHYECQIRSVVGGANHQDGTCTCCGGSLEPDPPGLSRREAAILACRRFERRRAL